ncbi:MAG TPA: hypothetical protein VI685_07315 [Candidatus Angelobacter sp.]
MSRSPSDEETRHILLVFRQSLGRDLSPEEQKYLGLSSVIVSPGDPELAAPATERRLNLAQPLRNQQARKKHEQQKDKKEGCTDGRARL